MTRLLPFLFLAAAAAEIASIIWVGSLIGVIPTLLLMALGGILGVRLMKSAGMSVAEALRSPVQPQSGLGGLGGQAATKAASGILFLLPGFFSDAVALLLFVPQVRRWLGSRFRVDTIVSTAHPPRQGGLGPIIIEAEAVEISGEIEPPGPSAR